MGSRRTLITIAAVAVGAIAVFLIYGYVGSVRDEAYGEAERVRVFVVQETVTKGTYGEETTTGLIVEDEIPKKFFPPNAIRSLDDIGGKQAVADLAVNQIVTTDMFADPAQVQSTFSDRLEKINGDDQVAITISVDEVRGVAGLLQPGDYVNVLLRDLCEAGGEGGVGGGQGGGGGGEEGAEGGGSGGCQFPEDLLFTHHSRYLYQKAQVLAIDKTPVTLPGEASTAGEGEAAPAGNTGLITLIVPVEAAQYITSVEPERIYLALVSRDYTPEATGPIDPRDPLPAEDPNQLTPYGPAGPDGE